MLLQEPGCPNWILVKNNFPEHKCTTQSRSWSSAGIHTLTDLRMSLCEQSLASHTVRHFNTSYFWICERAENINQPHTGKDCGWSKNQIKVEGQQWLNGAFHVCHPGTALINLQLLVLMWSCHCPCGASWVAAAPGAQTKLQTRLQSFLYLILEAPESQVKSKEACHTNSLLYCFSMYVWVRVSSLSCWSEESFSHPHLSAAASPLLLMCLKHKNKKL